MALDHERKLLRNIGEHFRIFVVNTMGCHIGCRAAQYPELCAQTGPIPDPVALARVQPVRCVAMARPPCTLVIREQRCWVMPADVQALRTGRNVKGLDAFCKLNPACQPLVLGTSGLPLQSWFGVE
jgi:hypothetical protein